MCFWERFVLGKRFRWNEVATFRAGKRLHGYSSTHTVSGNAATQDALPAEDIFALHFIIFHYLYESYRILENN